MTLFTIATLALAGCGATQSEASKAKASAASWFKTNVPKGAKVGAVKCLRMASPDEFDCSASVTIGTVLKDYPIDLLVACDAAGGGCDARKMT